MAFGCSIIGATAAHAQSAADNTNANSVAETVSEIVVTAQRRNQSVQDIPYNISVVTADSLTAAGVSSANDITRVVPGLTTLDTGPAARGATNNFTLRGLRTDAPGGGSGNAAGYSGLTVSPVSTYFGDVPVFFPIVLDDIERVEVLRGPQGTLYGSGSQAGTIRFIPQRPNFSGVSGDLNVSSSYTKESGSPNYNVNGVLNVPLAENLAVRMVAGEEHLDGFINQANLYALDGNGTPVARVAGDPTSGPLVRSPATDTNTSNQWFARAALRWNPTDAIDLQLDYIHQYTKTNDNQVVNPTYPGGVVDFGEAAGYPNSAFMARAGNRYTDTALMVEPYEDRFNLVSLVGTFNLGLGTFSSVSSYTQDKTYSINDATGTYLNPGGFSFLPYYGNYPRLLVPEYVNVNQPTFTQEMRFVSSGKHTFDYVVGAYYQNARSNLLYSTPIPGIYNYFTDIGLAPPTTAPIPDLSNAFIHGTRFEDRAVFGELTWNITDKWQLTGGMRLFWQDYASSSIQEAPICGVACSTDGVNPNGVTTTQGDSKVHSHISKVNMAYDISSELKVYATFSEGFRHGGVNTFGTTGPFAQSTNYLTFEPDLAKNYEIGIKGTLFDRRMQYSADVYRINLYNFQFNDFSSKSLSGVFNGILARSQGVEFELQAKLTDRLQGSVGYNYTQAESRAETKLYDLTFTCDTPLVNGLCNYTTVKSGAQLPGIPRNTVSASLDYKLPLIPTVTSGWYARLHIDETYHSKSNATIDPSTIYFWVIPSSFISNGRVTFENDAHPFSVDVFVNNLTNDPGYTGGRGNQVTPNYYATRYVTRPRTVGAGVHWRF